MSKDILGRPVLTAAELDAMTPEQREAAVDASIVLELIRAELAKAAAAGEGRSREEFVADLFVRFGIDPASPEYQAAAARADASVRYSPPLALPVGPASGESRDRPA